MPDNPANYSDAKLAARLPIGATDYCFLWQRSEVVDERTTPEGDFWWYELTFGNLPSRSLYAEQLNEQSRFSPEVLAQAAIRADAWIDTQAGRSNGRSKNNAARAQLREEDRRLADRANRGVQDPLQSELSNGASDQSGAQSPAQTAEGIDKSDLLEGAVFFPNGEANTNGDLRGSLDLRTAHVVGIHPELECRVSRAMQEGGPERHIVSFFNPAGGMPTVVNSAYAGVEEAVARAQSWAASMQTPDSSGFSAVDKSARRQESRDGSSQAAHSDHWWPVLRQLDGEGPSENDPLIGLVQASDREEARRLALAALDYGIGPERLHVSHEPAKFPSPQLAEKRYVMWTVDGRGVAKQYTSAPRLADVADVAAGYRSASAKIGGRPPVVMLAEWNSPEEPPEEIVLGHVDNSGERTSFQARELGRAVSEQEVNLALQERERASALRPVDDKRVETNYLVWEVFDDGAARRRAYEMREEGARERAVELALAARREGGSLPVMEITTWNSWNELPPRTVRASLGLEMGRSVDFDLEAEIARRHPAPERDSEARQALPEVAVVRVQSVLDVKPGDYLKIGKDSKGQQIGYLQASGLAAEQLSARPQYAVMQRGTGRVIASRLLLHHAMWAAEPYLDAAYQATVDLKRQQLPAISGLQNGTPAELRKQTVEPDRSVGQESTAESVDRLELPPDDPALYGNLPSAERAATTAVVYRQNAAQDWQQAAELRVADFSEVEEIFGLSSPGDDVRVTSSQEQPLAVGDVVVLEGYARSITADGKTDYPPPSFMEWQQEQSKAREVDLEP